MRSNKPRGRLLLAIGAMMLSGSALAAADLVLNVNDSPDPGLARGTFNYEWRVDNNGPDQANDVVFVHTYPVGATFVSVAPATGCVDNGTTRTLTCQIGSLANGASATRNVKIMLPVVDVWTNDGKVSSSTPDNSLGNNTLSEPTTTFAASDLKLTATTSNPNPVAGASYNYLLDAENLGPSNILSNEKLEVTISVPSGAAITARPTGVGWSCAPASGYPRSSGDIICERTGALNSGATAGTITVPAVANTTGDIILLTSIKGYAQNGTDELPDGDLGNNESTVTVTTTAGSDVSIVKTQSPSGTAIEVGGEVTYTLAPRHEGGVAPGSSGNGKIIVKDTLSAGLTYVPDSAVGNGWSCVNLGQEITCERDGPWLGGAFSAMPAITLKATATIDPDQNLSNTGEIIIPEIDPNPANNTDTVGKKTTNEANLVMQKGSTLAYPAMVGAEFFYQLRTRNAGPLSIPAGDTITITDTLPAGIELRQIVAPTGWTCGHNAGILPAANATVTCTSTQGLAANTNTKIINLRVAALTPGAITNTACVALNSGTVKDETPADNCANSGITATQDGQHADVSIGKAADKTTLQAGEFLRYTLTVGNAGPAVATEVEVRDVLSNLLPGTTGGVRAINAPAGTICTPTNPPTFGANITIICTIPSLAVGATQDITIDIVPNVTGALAVTRTNTATAYSKKVGDKTLTNNTASVNTEVTPIVDMTIDKSAAPDPVNAGGPLTYTVTVKNNGPSTATGIVVTDTLPALASFIEVSEGACATQPAVGDLGGTLGCQIPDLSAGSQQVLKYLIRPTIDAVGQNLVNTVEVTTASTESDLTNNDASTNTPVIAPELDILVNKNDSPDPVDLGELVTYTIRINNSGPSAGSNLNMVDIFPVNGTATNPTAPTAVFSYQGNLTTTDGGTCTEPPIGATSGTLECNWDQAFDKGARTVTYQMRSEVILNSEPTGTTYNKVTVKVDEDETQASNNEVTEPTTTRRKDVATDLAGTKTASPEALLPGKEVTFTLGVQNLGPVDSTGAQIADPLPAGLTFVSASAGCFEAAGTVTCAVGDLAVNDSVSFTITAKVDDDFTGKDLENQAFINAPGDTDPGNNNPKSNSPVIQKSVGVPTLSEWALIILAMLMALGAYMMMKRNSVIVR